MTGGDDEPPMTSQAEPFSSLDSPADSPAERGRRNLALLIGVTIGVMAFGLAVFAWMYWINPIRG